MSNVKVLLDETGSDGPDAESQGPCAAVMIGSRDRKEARGAVDEGFEGDREGVGLGGGFTHDEFEVVGTVEGEAEVSDRLGGEAGVWGGAMDLSESGVEQFAVVVSDE
jgi:hypothetical protein